MIVYHFLNRWAFFLLLTFCLIFAICSFVVAGESNGERRVSHSSPQIELLASIGGSSFPITAEIPLTISATSPADWQMEEPIFSAQYGDFQVVSQEPPAVSMSESVSTTRWVLKLRSLKSGDLILPPIPITFRQSVSGEKVKLLLPASGVNIRSDYESVSVTEDDLSSTAPIFYEYPRNFIILLFCAIVVGGFILYYLSRHRRRIARDVAAPTPYEIADTQLSVLMDSKIYEKDTKEFYLRLTAIVRRYIEGMTGVKAPEQTTEEFLREITSNFDHRDTFRVGLQERLKSFLEFADLVKFAKFNPTLDDIFSGYKSAKTVIDHQFEVLSQETATSVIYNAPEGKR